MDNLNSIQNKVDRLTRQRGGGIGSMNIIPNKLKTNKWLVYVGVFIVIFIILALFRPNFVTTTDTTNKTTTSTTSKTTPTTPPKPKLSPKKLLVWSMIISLPLNITLYFNISKK